MTCGSAFVAAAPAAIDLEAALIRWPGGARRLVLLAGAAGRRGPLVGEVLTGWDGCSTTRRE
jgi:hypothetical protein